MNFTKNQNDKILTWANALENINKDKGNKWIVKNHNIIYKYIVLDKHYTNQNTIKAHLTALAGVLRALNGPKNVIKAYELEAVKISNELKNDSKDQKLSITRKENYLNLFQILSRHDELEILFNSDKNNKKNNLAFLLLSLYTLQPPIRLEYSNMKILNDLPEDQTQNFILKNNNKYTVYINNDKVIRSHGPVYFNFSNELNDIINESLFMFPREYILSTLTDGEKPINKQGIEYLFKYIFSPLRVSVDVLRSAYITHFYNDPSNTIKDKEHLARLMRHSADIAAREYYKIISKLSEKKEEIIRPSQIDSNPPTDQKKSILDIVGMIKNNNIFKKPDNDQSAPNSSPSEGAELQATKAQEPSPDIDKEQPIKGRNDPNDKDKTKKKFNLKKWGEDYRKTYKNIIRDKQRDLYERTKGDILRNKILYNLNMKNTTKPHKKTIEKYNIIYDHNIDRWI